MEFREGSRGTRHRNSLRDNAAATAPFDFGSPGATPFAALTVFLVSSFFTPAFLASALLPPDFLPLS